MEDEGGDINTSINEIFDTGKHTSQKQKEHLARAREAAKKTIEYRRELARREDARQKEEKEEVEKREHAPLPPPPEEPPSSKAELTDEEKEEKQFGKWMKNLQKAQLAAIRQKEEEEERNKVLCSFSKEEHARLMRLVDEDNARAMNEG